MKRSIMILMLFLTTSLFATDKRKMYEDSLYVYNVSQEYVRFFNIHIQRLVDADLHRLAYDIWNKKMGEADTPALLEALSNLEKANGRKCTPDSISKKMLNVGGTEVRLQVYHYSKPTYEVEKDSVPPTMERLGSRRNYESDTLDYKEYYTR